jgi:uncharacterized protein (DUF2225 family)
MRHRRFCHPLSRLLLGLCLALALSTPGQATTLGQRKFTCGLCGEKFTDKVVYSTNVMERDAEFRTYAAGLQPMAFYPHTCPACGFTDTSHDVKLSEAEKAESKKFLATYCQKHDCKKLSPSQKYEVIAHICVVRQLSSLKIAYVFHQAAWMADDEKNREGAERFRSETLRLLNQALEKQEVKAEMVPTVTYLVGELNRRLGNFDEALKWFARVKPDVPQLTKLLEQQQKLASEHNAAKAMMPVFKEEAPKGEAPKKK